MHAIPTVHILKLEEGDEKVYMPFPDDPCLPIKVKRKKKQYHKKDPEKQARLEETRALKQHHKDIFRRKQRMSVIKKKLCRFCTEEKVCTVEFAAFCKWDIDIMEVLKTLELNTDYNDLLSEIVCEECFNQICTLSVFKTNCRSAEITILRELAQLDPDTIKIGDEEEYLKNNEGILIKKEDVGELIDIEEVCRFVDLFIKHQIN